MPYLEFEHQTKPLGPGVLTIGSGSEAAWRITGRDLAALHAIITMEKGGYALVAAGNPQALIHVNGVEVTDGRGIVRYGDSLRLGRAEFRFTQLASGNDGRGGFLRELRRGRSYKLGDFTEIVGETPRQFQRRWGADAPRIPGCFVLMWGLAERRPGSASQEKRPD